MATTNSFYAASGDGYVGNVKDSLVSFAAALTAAKNDSNGNTYAYTTTIDYIGGNAYTASTGKPDYQTVYYISIKRGFFSFDISSIGSGNTISSATFFIQHYETIGVSRSFYIVGASQASTGSLTNADWDNIGSTIFGTLVVSGTAGYSSVSLNSDGITYLNNNKTSFAKLALLFSKEIDGGFNDGDSFETRFSFTERGSSTRPYLSITYDTASSYFGVLKRYNGSSWVKEPIKYYTGSTWASGKPLKRYDGSEWKTVDTTGV